MDTSIGYLRQLGEDLQDAAAQSSLSRARSASLRGPSARGGRWIRLAASAAAILTVAGLIGYVVRPTGEGGSGAATVERASASQVSGAAAPAPDHGQVFAPYTGNEAAGGGGASGAASADALQKQAALAEQAPAPQASNAHAVTVQGLGGIGDVSKIVKTAQLSLVVARNSFAQRFQAASEIAGRLGGFVQSSSEQTRSGNMVIRVPVGRFDAARRELKGLGIRTESESIQGNDVTAQFVDLKSRLEILQAHKEALVRLLRKAGSLDTILRLRNAVDDVLTRIEELKGQIKLLNDQAGNATIAIEMREEGVEPNAAVHKPSLFTAWDRAVAGFLNVVGAIIVGLGYLLPLIAIALAVWLFQRYRRRPIPLPPEASDA